MWHRVADALLDSEQLQATLWESIRSGANPAAQHALLVLLPCCHVSRPLAETLRARGLSKVGPPSSPAWVAHADRSYYMLSPMPRWAVWTLLSPSLPLSLSLCLSVCLSMCALEVGHRSSHAVCWLNVPGTKQESNAGVPRIKVGMPQGT